MTGKELAAYIGRTGYLRTAVGIDVAVTVTDARVTYGSVHIKVEPTCGRGAAWVQITSVELED